MDDDHSIQLLDDLFWPDGLICILWLTQAQYRLRVNNDQTQRRRNANFRAERSGRNWTDPNP